MLTAEGKSPAADANGEFELAGESGAGESGEGESKSGEM